VSRQRLLQQYYSKVVPEKKSYWIFRILFFFPFFHSTLPEWNNTEEKKKKKSFLKVLNCSHVNRRSRFSFYAIFGIVWNCRKMRPIQPWLWSYCSHGDSKNLDVVAEIVVANPFSKPLLSFVCMFDWCRRGEKGSEGSFRSMMQENLSSPGTTFQQESGNNNIALSHHQPVHWRPEKLFSAESSSNEFKRGFSLDQTQFSPQYSSGDSTVTSQGLPCTFQMDYVGNPSSILQGLLGHESNNQQPHQGGSGSFENRPMNFPYSATSYGLSSNIELVPSWSKVPQFLRASPPKQPPNNQLHFTNNAPFWNANSEPSIKDARSSFISSLQPPFSPSNFDVQSKVLHFIFATQ